MEVTLNIDDAEVRAAFSRMLAAGRNPRPALASIGRYGVSSTRLRFRNQAGPDGTPWPKSSRVLKHGGQTLRLTGRLRNSITSVVGNSEVSWGTNVAYGPAQQFGLDDPAQRVGSHARLVLQAFGKKLRFGVWSRVAAFARRMKIPARPFLGISPTDQQQILSLMEAHVV